MKQKIKIALIIVVLAIILSAALFLALSKNNNNLPEKASSGGPLDAALAEVSIISVEGDIATIEIGRIIDYARYPKADYEQLRDGDRIYARIYYVAPDGPTQPQNLTTEPAGTKHEDLRPQIGRRYLADLSLCITDKIGGLSCTYDGWSAALYPIK